MQSGLVIWTPCIPQLCLSIYPKARCLNSWRGIAPIAVSLTKVGWGKLQRREQEGRTKMSARTYSRYDKTIRCNLSRKTEDRQRVKRPDRHLRQQSPATNSVTLQLENWPRAGLGPLGGLITAIQYSTARWDAFFVYDLVVGSLSNRSPLSPLSRKLIITILLATTKRI